MSQGENAPCERSVADTQAKVINMVASKRARACFFAVLFLLCAGLIGAADLFFIKRISDFGGKLEGASLISMTSTAAAVLEPDDVADLRGARQNANDASYLRVREELRRLKSSNDSIRFVYLIGEGRKGIVYLADAEDDASPNFSPPGQLYSKTSRVLQNVFATGKPGVETPAANGADDWATSFAPVKDKDGAVMAVIGFDVSARNWMTTSKQYKLLATALVASVSALFILFCVAFVVESRFRRRVTRLNAELETRLAELSLSNRIVENSSTVLFRLDVGKPPTALTYVSRNLERYGYRPEVLLARPKTWLGLFHPEDRNTILKSMTDIIEGKTGATHQELRFLQPNGEWVWFNAELSGVRDEKGALIAFEGIIFDISESKRDAERIAHLANHDALTGLSNRAFFLTRLNDAFSETKDDLTGLAVLYVDIDHFKDLNDAFGHEQGDVLLLAIAERMRKSIRDNDVLGRFSVARFGGDEFAILQTGVREPADAAALAQRLLRAISKPFNVNGVSMHVTASIGVALNDSAIAQPADMLAKADLALYRAKEAGRNQFAFHTDDLDVEVRERVAIGEELRAALKNRELELHYQPQVDGASGRIIGFEALMRWSRGPRGPVSPEIFIPIAERLGLISALGDFALEEACAQIARWRAESLKPPVVGVNISALQLGEGAELVRRLKNTMRRCGVPADALELELTETALAGTMEKNGDILRAIRSLGARLAIDDFGTGYSSLQYLHAFPISRIKIAQQFISKLANDEDNRAIVRATISLAKALQMEVIAEGVEKPEQLAFLMAHGCRSVQGFYFSRPVTADEATALLKKGGFTLFQSNQPSISEEAKRA